MSPSTFEILIVPVLKGTLGAYVGGAAILTLMKLANAGLVNLVRTTRPVEPASGLARESWRRTGRREAEGVGSVG